MKNLYWAGILIAAFALVSWRATESMDDEVETVMSKHQAIGLSVVVVKNNKICYHHSYGYNPDFNDPTARKPIQDNGIYWIASVSKTFISTAIMQLVEKKKLKLDDDVSKYLGFRVRNPFFENIPITVGMLLCHRSSINDNHYGWNLDQINPEKGEKWRECYNKEKPGGKFFYCNLNYNLLGAVIEAVSGMRFDEYIDKKICEPLGLEASFNLTKIDSNRLVKSCSYDRVLKRYKPSRRVYDYQYVRDALSGYRLVESAASLSPAGGMKISATDLAMWMMVHMNYGQLGGKRIISKKSEIAMWQAKGSDRAYGFAFSRYPNILKDCNLYGMKGRSHGINSVMVFNPEEKYGFVVICNGRVPKEHGRSINDEIIRIMYNHFIKK